MIPNRAIAHILQARDYRKGGRVALTIEYDETEECEKIEEDAHRIAKEYELTVYVFKAEYAVAVPPKIKYRKQESNEQENN